ncbi:unnamed protein product [Schistosoma margrebowiei]|uniref:Uncharacterized protein n=1 Tax=Schistosoma margrebowiei TaxID=48269 RepID=A0A183M9F0_9TREM|nr:unnamed protein product [Schistosoma margrebowiei]
MSDTRNTTEKLKAKVYWEPTHAEKILNYSQRYFQFNITLNNRFQAVQDLLKEEKTTIEDNWKGITEALTSTCQEVLGRDKHHHKEYISIKTLNKIQERKNKKTETDNRESQGTS